ncbi:hypothetical protein [Paenarthrobacter sp. TA1.8]|uniref:hypothetical protein n=1 Tax=Paenarthrobacter sp. TA1.8 TaxID=3400219 RepID=UPI003B43586A
MKGVDPSYDDNQVFTSDASLLKSEGVATFDIMAAGILHMGLTAEGKDLAERFVLLKGDSMKRLEHAANVILRWLTDLKMSGAEAYSLSEVHKTSSANYLGDPFSEDLVGTAWEQLKSLGFVKEAIVTAGGEALRPYVTPEGIRWARSRRSVFDYQGGTAAVINNFSHNQISHSAIAVGNNNVQTVSLTQEQVQSIVETIGAIRGLMGALPVEENIREAAEDELAELEGELNEPGVSSGKVKELLGKVGQTLTEAGSNVLVAAVNGIIQSAMNGTLAGVQG